MDARSSRKRFLPYEQPDEMRAGGRFARPEMTLLVFLSSIRRLAELRSEPLVVLFLDLQILLAERAL